MKKYLLDTGIVRRIGINEKVTQKLALLDEDTELFISVLTLHEMYYGLSNAKGTKYEEKAQKAILFVEEEFQDMILPVTKESSKIFGNLKSKYKENTRILPENLKKHNIDFMIAAIAIEQNAILVSHDSIFKIIQGLWNDLQFEDWME